MPAESSSDLAGMFDPADFAERARYAPSGGSGGTDCLVVIDRGQGRSAFRTDGRDFRAGERVAVGGNRMLQAQRSELPAVARDGVFTMLDADGEPTGESYRVAGLPELDETGRLWTCDLVIVS